MLASQVWQPANYTQMNMHNYHVGVGYQQAPTQPESSVIASSGRRKALLIGINYFGTSNELRGCINDVQHMQELLMSEGFKRNDMVILTDDQRDRQYMPTRDNVLRGCQVSREKSAQKVRRRLTRTVGPQPSPAKPRRVAGVITKSQKARLPLTVGVTVGVWGARLLGLSVD